MLKLGTLSNIKPNKLNIKAITNAIIKPINKPINNLINIPVTDIIVHPNGDNSSFVIHKHQYYYSVGNAPMLGSKTGKIFQPIYVD